MHKYIQVAVVVGIARRARDAGRAEPGLLGEGAGLPGGVGLHLVVRGAARGGDEGEQQD